MLSLPVHLGTRLPRYQAGAHRPRLLRGGRRDLPGRRRRAGREDLKKIRGRVGQLTDEDWQNRRVALARGGRDPWGNARFQAR